MIDVYNRQGARVAQINSDNPAHIGNAATLQAMTKAGYKFKMNGKAYKPPKTERRARK